MTVHLTRAYRMSRSRETGRRFPSFPVSACGAEDGDQVSIYPSGEGEDRIDCRACQAWLGEEDNRLLLLDVSEWIRRHAGSEDIRYIDIPDIPAG